MATREHIESETQTFALEKTKILTQVAKTFNCGENEMAFNCELSTKLINHASSKMDSSSRKQVNFQWINFTAEARNVCL